MVPEDKLAMDKERIWIALSSALVDDDVDISGDIAAQNGEIVVVLFALSVVSLSCQQ